MTVPVVVCANLIFDGDDLLLVREAKSSALGRWSVPAGKLEPGETLREGAEREAEEETGLTVGAGALLGVYHCPETLEGGAAVTFVYRSTVTGGEIRTTESHPEVRFVGPDELARLMASNLIRGQYVSLALEASNAGRELPDDAVMTIEASAPPKGSNSV